MPRVHPEAALTRVGGQWVAATLDARLHTFESDEGISETGERIVELIDGERSIDDIVSILVEEFAVVRSEAEADALDFIRLLLDRRVLTLETTRR